MRLTKRSHFFHVFDVTEWGIPCSTSHIKMAQHEDKAVMLTANDAISCKRYAVAKGYWRDEFIKHFCPIPERKSPEISRGYFARVTAVQILLKQFIEKCFKMGGNPQVISLGAGSDTTFWVLHQEGLTPHCFVEVDFEDIVKKKSSIIRSTKDLQLALLSKGGEEQVTIKPTEIHSPVYHLVSGDLREIEVTGAKILECGLDVNLPTFILTECVLVYLKPEASEKIVRWMGNAFSTALFLNYDPMLLSDKFGEIMKQNVKARGCQFRGLDAFPNLETQRKRFFQNVWEASWAVDMTTVYSRLPQHEVKRIEHLELFDEKELLIQLLNHYCLSCGINDKLHYGLEDMNIFV